MRRRGRLTPPRLPLLLLLAGFIVLTATSAAAAAAASDDAIDPRMAAAVSSRDAEEGQMVEEEAWALAWGELASEMKASE